MPKPIILRPGAISQAMLEEALGCPVAYAEEHAEKPLSPGMKYRHYAPVAKVLLFERKTAFEAYLQENPNRARTVSSSLQAEELYALFRNADRQGCEEIVIYCDPAMQNNRALMNRLKRASTDDANIK